MFVRGALIEVIESSGSNTPAAASSGVAAPSTSTRKSIVPPTSSRPSSTGVPKSNSRNSLVDRRKTATPSKTPSLPRSRSTSQNRSKASSKASRDSSPSVATPPSETNKPEVIDEETPLKSSVTSGGQAHMQSLQKSVEQANQIKELLKDKEELEKAVREWQVP